MSLVDAAEVELGDHSVAFPLGNLAPVAPLHPSVTVGAQHAWLDRTVDLVQTVRIGGYLHPTAGNAARLDTDLDVRLASGVGPLVEAGLGVGVHHVVRQRDVLSFDEDTGRYTSHASLGRPALAASVGAAVGFDLGQVSRVPVTLLVDYHWLARTEFLPALAVGPLAILSVGVRVDLGRAS